MCGHAHILRTLLTVFFFFLSFLPSFSFLFFSFLFFFVFLRQGPSVTLAVLETHSVGQAGLEFRDPPAFNPEC